jgi:hypothetical protein
LTTVGFGDFVVSIIFYFLLRKNNWMKNKQEKNIISGKTTLL